MKGQPYAYPERKVSWQIASKEGTAFGQVTKLRASVKRGEGRSSSRVSQSGSEDSVSGMTSAKKTRPVVILLLVLLASAMSAHAQRERGGLHLEVHDPQGAALAAKAELVSEANEFHKAFQVGPDGQYTVQDLPFGVYRLSLTAEGFAAWNELLEIRSEVAVRISATLGVAPVRTQVHVSDSVTLVDPQRTGTVFSIGRQEVAEELSAQPRRSLFDLLAQQPGWLYEANGVLHPRGSEYDVQFIVDGQPFTQNRSPAFAPTMEADEAESMRVLTATYPAEYGRKLGGIVEVTTEKEAPAGWHGQLEISGGSYATVNGTAGISYARAKDRFAMRGNGFETDRYLDPPVVQNYTNDGNAAGFSASYERDFSERDRVRAVVRHGDVHYLVPNDLVQRIAGQRQQLENSESSGLISFQHTISPNLFLNLSGSVRDASVTLRSNLKSTPIIVAQQRGYQEGYARGDLAGHHGHHDWKFGADAMFGPAHEALQYVINDPRQFAPGTQSPFQFAARKWDAETSGYVQNQIHYGQWNVSAGLRFDYYRFVVQETAWSPRLGVSRYLAKWNLVLHASYDRVFQTPAMENLLLASSSQLDSASPVVLRLPVQPARGNFYEGGVTKALFGRLRLDANVFRRNFQNYSDDDVLLDTGVSFPIALAKGCIIGEEVHLAVAQWGRFSGYLGYANQSGTAQGPITGGLFIGSEALNGLKDTSKFDVSQDQRNTAGMKIRYQVTKRVWTAGAAQYGSGLPADTGGETLRLLLEQYGPEVLRRVNVARGRVRPSFSMDVGAGAELYRRDQTNAEIQVQAANLLNRVNVINFASVFSGTAVAPPRSISARLRLTF
jgi:hypothetical protein